MFFIKLSERKRRVNDNEAHASLFSLVRVKPLAQHSVAFLFPLMSVSYCHF